MRNRPRFRSLFGFPLIVDILLGLAILALVGAGTIAAIALMLFHVLIGQPSPGVPPAGPTPLSGTLLFHDDFTDPASGWAQVTLPAGTLRYVGSGYRIQLGTPNGGIAAPHPGLQNLGDVRVEVTVTDLGTLDDLGFGITCRDRNDDNHYDLTISGDGSAAIRKVKWGIPLNLALSGPQPGAVRPGHATNQIRAECVGATLALWANGQLLLAAQDTEFQAGRIRLIALAGPTPGVTVVFTDLRVLQP